MDLKLRVWHIFIAAVVIIAAAALIVPEIQKVSDDDRWVITIHQEEIFIPEEGLQWENIPHSVRDALLMDEIAIFQGTIVARIKCGSVISKSIHEGPDRLHMTRNCTVDFYRAED